MKQNRCRGFNNKGKKCRTRINNNKNFFCCDQHIPINFHEIQKQCPICYEEIRPNDIRILRCNHAHHRGCLEEWLYSNEKDDFNIDMYFNDNFCCPICRVNIPKQNKKNKFY